MQTVSSGQAVHNNASSANNSDFDVNHGSTSGGIGADITSQGLLNRNAAGRFQSETKYQQQTNINNHSISYQGTPQKQRIGAQGLLYSANNYQDGIQRMNPANNLKTPEQRNLQFTIGGGSSQNKNDESNMSINHKNSYNVSLDENSRFLVQQRYAAQMKGASADPFDQRNGNQRSYQSSNNPNEGDELNITTTQGGVSFQRFKNTAFVGMATQSVRRSLNEMTQQIKKSKEIHDLMVERQNIENMIINSKLWSPTQGSQRIVDHIISQETIGSTNNQQSSSEYTSNVFGDKREELTKILKKRLNYIHQQSAINQHINMIGNQMGTSFNGSGSLTSPRNQKLGTHYPLPHSPVQTQINFRKSNNLSHQISPKGQKNMAHRHQRRIGGDRAGLFRSGGTDIIDKNSPFRGPKPGGIGIEINLNSEEKLPEISLKQPRQNQALVPGKGGNPFMNRNRDGSIDKKPVTHYNQNQQPRIPVASSLPEVSLGSPSIRELNITNQQSSIQQTSQQNIFDFSVQTLAPLASHVDAVIMDNSFKRQIKDQLNQSAITAKNKQHHVSYDSTKDTRTKENESLKRQMIYQTDIQLKMGQINKAMDEEFETLDTALEYLKLKQPHQLGQDLPGVSPKSNKKKHQNQQFQANGIESVMKSDSLNYISMIKSSKELIDHQGMDLLDDSRLHEELQEEQIRNFAMMLMRQRKMIGQDDLKRHQSFDTQLGMAFSAQNDYDGFDGDKGDQSSGSDIEGDEKMTKDEKSALKGSQTTTIQVLETEKYLKAKEAEFVNTIQENLIKEFNITGTAVPPKTPIESLYIIQKKNQRKKKTMDDVHPQVEVYLKKMKEQTLDALTSDVKARTGFFEFVKQNKQNIFVEKFVNDPKLNYFLECNKELVTGLPTVSKIQNKSLTLFGYRLNPGVCKALRIYLTNFKNCLNKIALDNNGLNMGENLEQLMQGIKAQEIMKQIVIIRNNVDDNSAQIITEIMERPMPKNLDELRIINCKISPASIGKILSTVECGNSHLRRLSLAGVGLNELGLDLLAEIVDHVRSLIDLDISWNGLRPNNHMKKFFEALGQNRSIQYLNLSWNNLMLPPAPKKEDQKSTAPMINVLANTISQNPVEGDNNDNNGNIDREFEGSGDDPLAATSDAAFQATTVNMGAATKEKKEKLDDYTQHLLDNILRIIKYNNHLIHLDLSYTRLDEMMILQLGTALRRSKSLVAVHFTGNPGVTEKTSNYLQDRVHCRAFKDRDLKTESQNVIQNLFSETPRQNKAFDGIVLQQIQQKQKFIKSVQGGQSFKPSEGGNGGFQLEFQRWLGHKFDIPFSGQWQMNSAWQDIKDQCWVCNKWCYTLFYWSPSVQTQIYRTYGQNAEQNIDPAQVKAVRGMVRAKPSQINQNRAPFIAGSFSNWEAREMIPILEFCEQIDLNRPNPIEMLKKQGRVGPEVEREEDLKTEKERAHLARIKDSIKNDYKYRWKACIQKSIRYKKAQHVNLDFAAEVDIRREDIFVFAIFAPPGQHLYYVGDPKAGIEHVNKCIVNLREEDVPIYEKINKFKVNQRVFKKDASVFKEWKEDTPGMLNDMIADDLKIWKCSRFIKDEGDRERVQKLLHNNYFQLKKIFTGLISTSSFPNIGQIDVGNFCDKCKIIDGKTMQLTDIDRSFIAANVTIEGQTLSPDNPSNALTRFEFMEFIVRIAHFKYCTQGQCKTVEEAFNRLMTEHIFPNANPPPWQEFRDEQLWTIEVNDVLEANLEGIKKIYNYYQEPRKKFMTMTDALNLMIRDTQIGIGEKEAIYCYGMSKMSVVFEQDNMGQYKVLKLVELLEMIGRIAHFKFKDNAELNESMSLAQKIEHILDIMLKLVGVPRKDVTLNILEESESDDDY